MQAWRNPPNSPPDSNETAFEKVGTVQAGEINLGKCEGLRHRAHVVPDRKLTAGVYATKKSCQLCGGGQVSQHSRNRTAKISNCLSDDLEDNLVHQLGRSRYGQRGYVARGAHQPLNDPTSRPVLSWWTPRTTSAVDTVFLQSSPLPSVALEANQVTLLRMVEAYSLKWFLLHAKQEHLHEFFRQRHLLTEVPFSELVDGDIDTVFAAIQDLEPGQREESEACFQEVRQLANRAGFDAVIAASRSKSLWNASDEHLVQRLGGMDSYLDKAFWTFLYRPRYWKFAWLLAGADAIKSASWEKHPKVPRVPPCLDTNALMTLGEALGHYFHTMEGRGQRCDVKVCDRGDLLYVFCFLEQPSRADPDWTPEGLRRRTHKPAQPLTFMYSQGDGALDTYIRAKPRIVWDVMAIFAQHVLKVKKLDPPLGGRAAYRLDRFKRRGFTFSYGPESGISSVGVRKLRLTPKFGRKRHLILVGDPVGGNEPIYDDLETNLVSLSLDDVDVTQVELKVVFDPTTYRKKRTLYPTITVPNRCSRAPVKPARSKR